MLTKGPPADQNREQIVPRFTFSTVWSSCSAFLHWVSGGYDHLILKSVPLTVSVHVRFMVSMNIVLF